MFCPDEAFVVTDDGPMCAVHFTVYQKRLSELCTPLDQTDHPSENVDIGSAGKE